MGGNGVPGMGENGEQNGKEQITIDTSDYNRYDEHITLDMMGTEHLGCDEHGVPGIVRKEETTEYHLDRARLQKSISTIWRRGTWIRRQDGMRCMVRHYQDGRS